jgi:capsular polysaccharide export protein
MAQRSFLFLQGPRTHFYKQLAAALRRAGQLATQLLFTVGDGVYWQGNRIKYQEPINGLTAYYEHLFAQGSFTDLIVFGDCRPVHANAIPIAQKNGVRVHVFEEGYIRPHWVTLEINGANAHSHLPNDPNWFRLIGAKMPSEPFEIFRGSFTQRAAHDVAYNLCNLGNYIKFPHYERHALHSPVSEYCAYVKRGFRVLKQRKRDNHSIGKIIGSQARYYVLPLQMDGDYQVRQHSPFEDMTSVMRHVMHSFALHAPKDALLIVKNHPLDPGFNDYQRLIAQESQWLGLATSNKERIVYLETGHLPTLLAFAAGCVTVNSTVGAQALTHDCPLITLGKAFYDMQGLTHQGGLDSFWKNPEPIDHELYEHFRRTVLHTTQINGGFYTREGIRLAVKNALPRLLADQSPLEVLGVPC